VSPGRWFSRRFTGTWRGGLILFLLCLAVYVPGQRSIPPVDRDESRFAQASRQMAESAVGGEEQVGGWGGGGGWVVPRIQDRPRLNKPPLIYWSQAAAVKVFGDRGRLHEGIWVYRLPSLLAAIATVMLTWRLGLTMFDPRAAWLGAAMLAVAPLYAWEAHQARADQLLVLTVIATQFALYRLWCRSPSASSFRPLPIAHCLLFWLPLALGIMTKGPITPMIAALTALALCLVTRRWRWLVSLRPALGLVVITAVVGPWVYLVARQVGWSTYLSTIYAETIGRAGSPMEGHWGPPGYHLIVLTVLFWPGTLLTAAAVVGAFPRAIRLPARTATSSFLARLRLREPGRTPELFLLAWIIPSWLVFELVSTKLPHYTMPLYPAVALLSARAVLEAAAHPRPRNLGDRIGLIAWLLIGLALTVAIPAAFVCLTPAAEAPLPVVLAVVAAVASAVSLFIAIRTRLIVRTQVAGVIAAAIGIAALVGVILPASGPVWLSPRLVSLIDAADPSHDRPIGLIGYHEDSMLFLTRGRAQRLSAHDLPGWIAENPDGLVAVATAPGRGLDEAWPMLREISRVSGFNYSTGDPLDVILTEIAR